MAECAPWIRHWKDLLTNKNDDYDDDEDDDDDDDVELNCARVYHYRHAQVNNQWTIIYKENSLGEEMMLKHATPQSPLLMYVQN